MDIEVGLRTIRKELKEMGINFALAIPVVKGSEVANVIPDTCSMIGTMRSFDPEDTMIIKEKLEKLIRNCANEHGCKVDVMMKTVYPALKNTEKEAEHVIRIGKKVLGENNVITEGLIPVKASEDFAFFTKFRPGAFFFLSARRKDTDALHSNCYNPDEKVITISSEFWLKLIAERFEISLEL